MFLSEKRWLCSLEYLMALASYVTAGVYKLKEKASPMSPQLEIKGEYAHLYIYGPLVSDPDPFIVSYSNYVTTYQSIQEDIDTIKANKNIKKVFLHINSPGGTVEGVDDTWKAIKSLRKTSEVIAVNEGEIASAAYWLASAANKIIALSETNEQGSIGVMAGYIDWTKADEKAGIEEKIFVSKNAKYKHPAQSGFDEKLQSTVDNLEDIFISRISEGRDLTLDKIYANFGKGSMLLSKEALQAKMIDSISDRNTLFGGSDEPAAINSNKGDDSKMTLAEMLADPGVVAEIQKREIAAKQSGKEEAFSAVKAVLPILESNEYPKYIKDCALSVCDGKQSKDMLDGMVTAHDQQKAEWALLVASKDKSNKEPTPAIPPTFSSSERTLEDRIKNLKGSK